MGGFMKKLKQVIAMVLIVSSVTSLLQTSVNAEVTASATEPIPYDNADTGTDEP
jgi:hypothetical protein